jgi:hypothetical protein
MKLGPGGRLCLLLAAGMVPAAGGCGGSGGDPLVRVTGRVTVAGAPLTTGVVSFRPDGSRGNTSQHHPTGRIDEQGNYELFTVGRSGAPVGWYKVVVIASEKGASGSGAHPVIPKSLVHARYGSEQTTDLVREVVAEPAPDAYDLKLSR